MLRVVFMGTPEFAVPTLAGLLAAGHQSLPSTPSRRVPPAAGWRSGHRPCTGSPPMPASPC